MIHPSKPEGADVRVYSVRPFPPALQTHEAVGVSFGSIASYYATLSYGMRL